MLKEAEVFAEEDKILKDNIDCRNGLESYLYNLKNTLDDDGLEGNISNVDKKDLQDITDEALDWLEDNADVAKDECLQKKKEVENIANPIMMNLYSGSGGAGDDEGDFGDDEL